MQSTNRFWDCVSKMERAIAQSNSERMRNWWKLRLSNFMLKLECYESKLLN